MHSKKAPSIFSFHKLHLLLTFYLILLSVLGTLTVRIESQSVYAAATSVNPLVFVAIDLTPSSCIETRVISSHTTHAVLSKTQFHCPPGSDIGIVSVPLSQAKARHELYAPPLPAHTSLSVRMKWFRQIQQLMEAKKKELRVSSSVELKPYSNCGYDESIYTNGSFYGDWLGFEVYYHVSLTCSTIVLNREEVIGSNPVNGPDYWVEVKYYSYDKTCPVHYDWIGANTLNSYPGVADPIGYDNYWYIATGNECIGTGGAIQLFSVSILY